MHAKHSFFLILSLVLFLCFISCRTTDSTSVIKDVTYTPYWAKWHYLKNCRGFLDLPALYTDSTDFFLTCCITGSKTFDTAFGDIHVDPNVLDPIPVINNVEATLCTLMTDALPNSVRSRHTELPSILSSWHSIIYGITYISVAPSSIQMSFDQKYCALPDSLWFSEGKDIAVGAVMIDSIIMISENKMSPEKELLLDASLITQTTLNKRGLVFSLDKSKNGYFRARVKHIIYAVKTISPYVRTLHIQLDTLYAGQKYSYNGFSVLIDAYRDNPSLCQIIINPPRGRKATYCGELDQNRSFAITAKSIGIIKPQKTTFGYSAEITLSIIGVRKEEIENIFY